MDLAYPIGKFDFHQPVDPAARPQLIATLAGAPALFRQAVTGLDDAQLDTPYRPGGWTVRQVVHHLADSHINSYVRFRLALTEDQPAVKGYDQKTWAELPDARLTLVGPGLEQAPSSDQRVDALGFVEDLRAAYASAACAVVPLLQGGGSPLKFIEALAYGLPVIATSRAAAGLEVSDGEDCLIADGGEQFAAALVQVLRDGAPQLAHRGRQLAVERYSIQALSVLLAD